MAKKSWSVTTDEGTFSVELKGSKIFINGAQEKLSKLAKKTHFVDVEYTVPLGNRTATLFVQSMTPPVLSYNGYDCATGQPWEYEKIPGWGIAFFVLDLLTIIWSGWIWALLAILVTAVVIRSKLNMAVKIILSILMVIASLAGGTIAAILINSL